MGKTVKLPDCVQKFIPRFPILTLRRAQTAGPDVASLGALHPEYAGVDPSPKY